MHETGEYQNLRNVQIRGVRELELMVTELTLTYMDIIIDKDHGSIDRERTEYINQFYVELSKDKEVLMSYVDTDEETAAMERVFDGVARMYDMGKKELIPAVTGRAGEDVFDNLDDKFDEVSTGIKSDITKIIVSINEEIKEADIEMDTIILEITI